MARLKKFMVYLEDSDDIYKVAVPAEDVESAIKCVRRYWGEVIAVKDVTADFPIFSDKVMEALREADFGNLEIMFILRALEDIGICEPNYHLPF